MPDDGMLPVRPDKYRRLDAFLKSLHKDVYPEPITGLHSNLTRQMFEFIQKDRPLPPGSKVLDVGCGQGVALALFQQAGLDALGIALGSDVDICREKGFSAIEMDLSFLEFDDCSFDMVWCRHALEHSAFPYFTITELHRVLKPGGLLYVEVPAPDTSCHHERNPNHYSVLGKSVWVELLMRGGFNKDGIEAIDIDFTSGMGPDRYWGFKQRRPAA